MSKKILVVEDNGDIREIMQVYLGGLGFEVILAGDGSEGLAVATRERPDVIVTDASMPKLNGIEMIEQLRGRPEFTKVPIIIVTGVSSEMQDEAKAAGADRVLVKPTAPSALLAEINELIGAGLRNQYPY